MSPSFIASNDKHTALLFQTDDAEVLEGGVLILKRCALSGHRWSPASTREEEFHREDGPPQFCAIKSGSLSSNPEELVAIGVTKISEISAIRAHARRILD